VKASADAARKKRRPTPAPVALKPGVAELAQMEAYLRRLADGSEYVAQWTRKAAQRHFSDLERQDAKDFEFLFDVDRAAKVLRFCGALKHVKGDITGQPLVLHPWMSFFLASLFGWRRKDNGARRFRRVFAFVPRGNAKSTLLSAAALYATFAEGGQNDSYTIATKREQAAIVWGDAASMMRASPKLRDNLGVTVGAHAILQKATNSTLKPLPSESKSLDGLNVSFAVIDETHEVPRALAEVITTALGKRASSVMVSISTAGFDSTSYAYEQYQYIRGILDGHVQDELTFGLIFEAPDPTRWMDEREWRAANPMFGESVRPEIMGQAAEQAKRLPGSRASFCVKHLNLWQESHSPWMDMAKWDACADGSLKREDFVGRALYLGLDLATTHDFCARLLVFPGEDEGRRTYTAFADFYLNSAAIEATPNDSIKGWAEAGIVTVSGTDETEYAPIKTDAISDRERFDLRETCYDPYLAPRFAQELEAEGLTMVETRQTVLVLSPAMKEVEAAVYSGRFRHDGNPVLRMCIGNVVARVDANDNVFPRKENKNRYIDGATALFNAMSRASVADVGAARPRVWGLED
jgi:phage terminase large subunit-like protein